jgi:serine/threonine protein kinase
MQATPLINEWEVLKSGQVYGVVKNHPEIKDGDYIKTSPLADPGSVKAFGVVVTKSGSKYKLGSPAIGVALPSKNGKVAPKEKKIPPPISKAKSPKVIEKKAPPPKVAASASKTVDKGKALQEALRKAKIEYKLTGQVIGDGKYALAGKSRKSTSGKSTIWTAYRVDKQGLPQGDPVTVKISNNFEALEREARNYRKVTGGLGNNGQFVQFVEYMAPAGNSRPFDSQGAIVVERGDTDLKDYLRQNGPLKGKQLREVAVAAIQCAQALHGASLVWTDLKSENFVVQKRGSELIVKAIDLESAIQVGDNPVDYSPEACPPEFAEAFLEGLAPYFKLEKNYDTWSLGMLLYEIAVGRSIFAGKSPAAITTELGNPGYSVDVEAVPDPKLKSLIASMLVSDPKKRATIPQILLHPYFLTTGIGPFSF